MVTFTRKSFEPSQLVFDEGDAAESVYVLRSGSVKIRVAGENGKSATLADVEIGEVFGEVALLENRSHRAKAVASEKSVVLEIPRDEFLRRLNASDPVMKSVVNHLISRLRDVAG
ncbi:MAG: cyclic nucleotide-binding domain-containing protein [Alphaproteobacteria bacterium]|jgi:CRP-like cAMP-binding protein|nr:cyclic nucleotide-binding domain-containing protein [Alphaproteobacteria bacterium]